MAASQHLIPTVGSSLTLRMSSVSLPWKHHNTVAHFGIWKQQLSFTCPSKINMSLKAGIVGVQTSGSPHSSMPLSDKVQKRSGSELPCQEIPFGERRALLCSGAILITLFSLDYDLTTLPIRAEEKESKEQEGEEDKGLVGTITSLFDPNERTKSGKVLPKKYLKSAREVVKTLRDSLKEDPKDNAKFRRNADAAKESIREYLNDWRGEKKVVTEESYVALEKAIRSLAGFYSKAGPSASIPHDVKSNILDDLNTADANL